MENVTPPSAPIQDETIIPNQVEEEFKPIHRMRLRKLERIEKIDYIYKFKKTSEQVGTTMNYNMNSNLDEMRNLPS